MRFKDFTGIKILLLFSAFCYCAVSNAQFKFKIADFSPDYYGIVAVSDTAAVFKPGTVSVFEKKSGKIIISVDSDELAFDVNNGSVSANVQELPYGTQSVLICEDFNFDGQKDLAIMDGQNSCYHGPSFQIYLAGKNGFKHNAAFTRLAQDFCGMFEVDNEGKQLHTMTKSGCCWHQFSTYKVINNQPVATIITETSLTYNRPTLESLVTYKINGTDTIKKETLSLIPEEIDTIFSFITISGKTAILFTENKEKTLYYAFLSKDQSIELIFPIPETAENSRPDFYYNSKLQQLKFINKDARYIIGYSKDGIPELSVAHAGKQVSIRSRNVGWVGVLTDIPKQKFINVRTVVD